MLKTFAKFLPFLDHLYIYQILEYNIWDFLKWVAKHPFARNLQKKHKLEFTEKIKILLLLTGLWMIIAAVWLSSGNFILIVLFLIFFQFLSPLFILLTHFTYIPIDFFLKDKILKASVTKIRANPQITVIAITGSFGKTSTKDILYTLLWKKYRVVKTPKSFNTPMGVACTIINDLKKETEIFIAEIGAYRRGEIKKLATLIKPKIGIITAVASQHLEKFGSLENIALAKFELPQSLEKDGIAILNDNFEEIKKLAPTVFAKVIFYGSSGNPFYATNIKIGIEGTSFTIHTPKEKTKIKIPLIGEHHVQNFLAAAAAAMHLGLTLVEIRERANLLLPTPHRLEIKKEGSLTIIDNTYNTNPKAAEASLKLLKEYSAAQRIIITPGLVELGKEAPKENMALAKMAAKVVDEFIIVGENAQKDLLKGLTDLRFPKSKIHLVDSTQSGINLLARITKPNAVVLLENDLPDQYF